MCTHSSWISACECSAHQRMELKAASEMSCVREKCEADFPESPISGFVCSLCCLYQIVWCGLEANSETELVLRKLTTVGRKYTCENFFLILLFFCVLHFLSGVLSLSPALIFYFIFIFDKYDNMLIDEE